jgi:hypothetical protein
MYRIRTTTTAIVRQLTADDAEVSRMKIPPVWVASSKMWSAELRINPKARQHHSLNQPKLIELETTNENYVVNLENVDVQ